MPQSGHFQGGFEMTDMVAVAYPNDVIAKKALAEIRELHAESVLDLTDAVLVTRDQGGALKLQNERDHTVEGAVDGALWGGLIGLLLLQPLLGAAVGAAIGGIDGASAEESDQAKFIKKLGERLSPGHAAVIALVEDATMDKVLPRISEHGGWILHTSLDNEAELQLRRALYASRRRMPPTGI
jgi:uncharacterized membrane protein